MLLKFLHSHKIPLQIAGKVFVLVVKILLVHLFTCLFVSLFVCLFFVCMFLICFDWPCLSCVGRFLTFAGVACHRWRCSALLVFCLALFSVVWLCWRWLCWRCWSLQFYRYWSFRIIVLKFRVTAVEVSGYRHWSFITIVLEWIPIARNFNTNNQKLQYNCLKGISVERSLKHLCRETYLFPKQVSDRRGSGA